MPGNGDGWQRRSFLNGGINGDNSLYSTFGEHLRIPAQESDVMAMNDSQKEVIALAQKLLNAADDR